VRKLAIVLGVLFSSSAFAQSSGIPWTNGRVLTAPMMQQFDAAKLNLQSLGKPGFAARLDAHGRIDAPVVGDVSQARATTDGKTVSQIGQIASGSVQQTEKNAANGVAGLDADADTTSGIKSPRLKLMFNGAARGQMLGDFTDPWTPPNMSRMGGLQTGTPLVQQLNGMPDGPNDSGVVQAFSAYDGSFSGIRPGFGPDALSNGPTAIANYGTLDSGVVSNQFDTPVPLVRAGADIKDWSGNTHAVTFGCGTPTTTPNRVCFSPALPAEWVALLHRGQYIITNVIGPGKTTASDVNSPDILASEVNAVAPDGSYIDTVGWSVPGSNISNGFVPMVSSYAGDGGARPAVAAGTLDTKWSNYTHPAVFIGASTSMFNNYTYCKLNHSGSHDSDKNINAKDSMVHSCTYLQHDMFNYDPDYTNAFTGVGLAYQGPSLPSRDSQMVWLSGYMPTFFRIRYTTTGIKLFDTDAGFEVDRPLVLPVDGTVGEASTRFLSAQEETINGIPLKLQKWAQMDATIPSGTTGMDFVKYASIRIGLNYGSGPNAHTVDAKNAGEIILNPQCGVGGIALAGGAGGTWNPSIGICVKSDGSVKFPNDMSITGGKSSCFQPTDTSNGWVCIYGSSGDTVTMFTSSGAKANLNISGAVTANGLTTLPGGQVIFAAPSNNGNIFENATSPNDFQLGASNGNGVTLHVAGLVTTGQIMQIPFGTPASSTAACTPGQIMTDATYSYTCVATNSWHRVSNGSAW